MDKSVLEQEFCDYNTLTVIASESYEDFAKQLQKEILESLSGRPTKLTVEAIKDIVLKNDK
jgi:type III restriction enzyme